MYCCYSILERYNLFPEVRLKSRTSKSVRSLTCNLVPFNDALSIEEQDVKISRMINF